MTAEIAHFPRPDSPPAERELTVTERALMDLQAQGDAIAKRAMQLGTGNPTTKADDEAVSDYEKRLFGTPVRLEVDVCIPIQQLKQEINSLRAQLTNCLAILEQGGPPNTRRHMVHSRLCTQRAQMRAGREERKHREKRQPPQPT